MKQISLSTLLLFFAIFLFGQSDNYSIIELKRGSLLSGNIVDKSYNSFTLQSSLYDTIIIRNRSIKRHYAIEENFDYRGDVPVLVRGRYYTFFAGTGGGRVRINPQNNPNRFFFPGSPAIIPVTRYSPVILLKAQGTVGYQFNRYFGLGTGLMIRYNDVALPTDIFPFGRSKFWARPFLEGKFTYPLDGYGNKDIWISANAFDHVEVVAGVSILRPKRRLNIGVGFFKSFNSFMADSYLSVQCGIQF